VLLAVYTKFTVFNSYFLETFSVYLLVVGWLFAPVMFNPKGLDSQAVLDDFKQWIKWMLSSGEVYTLYTEHSCSMWHPCILHAYSMSVGVTAHSRSTVCYSARLCLQKMCSYSTTPRRSLLVRIAKRSSVCRAVHILLEIQFIQTR
jgi:hypothetical protein